MWNSKFGKGQKAFSKSQKGVILGMFLGDIDNIEKRQYKKQKNPIKGQNIETQINISIEEAFFGLEKQIGLKDTEGNLKTYTVKIPQGIRNGEKIRLIGQGKNGENGGKNGDLLIKINIENDKKFKLKGNDIYTVLPLTPWEAVLGIRTSVKSLDSETKVYIPEGIQSGEKVRIANKGYYINKEDRGDLVAEIKVVVPNNISKEEKKLYEQLKAVSNFNPRT